MQVFDASWVEDCFRTGYRIPTSPYILTGTVYLVEWLMKLKPADALPIEDESTDVVPCQVSPLRPYVSPPSVNSFDPSNNSQSSTPDLDLAANCPLLNETDRYVYLEIEETPSKHSNISEKQVELAIFYENEDTPLENGLDSSGETLIEDASLLATHKESRYVSPFIFTRLASM